MNDKEFEETLDQQKNCPISVPHSLWDVLLTLGWDHLRRRRQDRISRRCGRITKAFDLTRSQLLALATRMLQRVSYRMEHHKHADEAYLRKQFDLWNRVLTVANDTTAETANGIGVDTPDGLTGTQWAEVEDECLSGNHDDLLDGTRVTVAG